MAAEDRAIAREAFIDDNLILVDVIQPIALRARELQWGIDGLKPYDAIHLATAEYATVDYFDTTDDTSIIKKVNQAVDFHWEHPMIVDLPRLGQTEIDFDEEE